MTTPAPGPIAAYLATPRPGVSADGRYLVLPRIVLDRLPPQVQQQVAHALSAVHHAVSSAWPIGYRVTALRPAPVSDLADAGLTEIGLIAELDVTGALVHRSINGGHPLTQEQLNQRVLVSAPDPLYS